MKQAGHILAQVVPFIWIILSFFSCRLKSDSPAVAEGQTAFESPITQPFTLPEAKSIRWKEYAKDSVPVGVTLKLDLDKLPYKSFSVHEFKVLKKPVKTAGFEWEKLQKKPFHIDSLGEKTALKVRKFLLPKPELTTASPPGLLGKGSSGLLKLGLSEGLQGMKAASMVTDPDGMVWMGTERGLIKYTGREFLT